MTSIFSLALCSPADVAYCSWNVHLLPIRIRLSLHLSLLPELPMLYGAEPTHVTFVWSDLLLDGFPTMAISHNCPCYLPIVGTVVERCQSLSTHRWSCTPSLWGHLLLRDPLKFSLGLQGTQLPWLPWPRYGHIHTQ